MANLEYGFRDRLIVDGAWRWPKLPNHILVKIGNDFYAIRVPTAPRTSRITQPDLRPIAKSAVYEPGLAQYALDAFDHRCHGLFLRGGYHRQLARPIQPDELTDLKRRWSLSDDDVSDPFTETWDSDLGPDEEQTTTEIQIRVPTMDALSIESDLRERGIFAFCGSPGRVNIRIPDVPGAPDLRDVVEKKARHSDDA